MAETGVAELIRPTRFPNWKEILEQGYFVSSTGKKIGTMQNAEAFSKLGTEEKVGNIYPGKENLGIHDKELQFMIPTFQQIIDANQNLNFDDYLMWYSTYSHTLSQSKNAIPHCDVAIDTQSDKDIPLLQYVPEKYKRFTVSTVDGTIFYPGRYELPSFKQDTDPKKVIKKINDTIVNQARGRQAVPSPELAIMEFNGLSVHSAPFQKGSATPRSFATITLEPKNPTNSNSFVWTAKQ